MNSFPKSRRVVKSREFTAILRKGSGAADGTLVMFARPSDDGQLTRLGVTIPKRAGCAVTRNRWKRLIRESYRTQQQSIPVGFDLIVRPKKGAEPNWDAIRRSLPRLAKKLAKRIDAG